MYNSHIGMKLMRSNEKLINGNRINLSGYAFGGVSNMKKSVIAPAFLIEAD